ncbi:MAG: hypothetical protein IT405_01820, partial [Candidatus Yanofskybacteria bacterium]|nr:hypothetical protein [Candidatus Yanofskybacteria bacterium]
MGTRQFTHSLFRWSIVAGLAMGLFWWVWAWFGPLPPYRTPDLKGVIGPRVWWFDVILVILLVNLMGWLMRAIEDSEFSLSGFAGGLVGAGCGMLSGDMFAPSTGWLIGLVFGGYIGAGAGTLLWIAFREFARFAWLNAKGIFGILAALVTGGVPLMWKRLVAFLSAAELETK